MYYEMRVKIQQRDLQIFYLIKLLYWLDGGGWIMDGGVEISQDKDKEEKKNEYILGIHRVNGFWVVSLS